MTYLLVRQDLSWKNSSIDLSTAGILLSEAEMDSRMSCHTLFVAMTSIMCKDRLTIITEISMSALLAIICNTKTIMIMCVNEEE